jgi:hypothetical protein
VTIHVAMRMAACHDLSMTNTIECAVKRFSTLQLQQVRRALELEALAWCQSGANSQALLGKIELLTAVGAELDLRSALQPSPLYVDTCMEDGVRHQMQVRVF